MVNLSWNAAFGSDEQDAQPSGLVVTLSPCGRQGDCYQA